MNDSLRFDRFELQPQERRLLADGRAVALGARAFDLLLALAERPGRLVDKHTLLDLVWPGLVVQENNLPAQMSALRKVLGEGIVATVPGRGYRFVAAISTVPGAPAAPLAAAAPAAALPAVRTQLPATLPELIGRDEELAALCAAVDASRLVTVVGPGGIGKSLLAQHLLDRRRRDYAHGVCWAELGTATPQTLVGTLAAALGVSGGAPDAQDGLRRALAPLQLLLALDTAEPLLDHVARLAGALLEAAPGLRLLVTSQAPLRLHDETVVRLGPLAVPEAGTPPEQAARLGAVRLFVQRARALDGRFDADAGQLATVAAICTALDGLPLAIELAAARAPTLGAQALLAAMQDRLRLLTRSGNRVAPPRQQTLRAALEWSLGCLDPLQRTAFRRLAVLRGSASLEVALEVVCDDEGGELDRWTALDALDGLVDWSLLAVVGGAGAEPVRYRLLESPRALALEGLAPAEHDRLRRRHARAMAGHFERAYERYYGVSGGADAWMAELGADLDNARAALAWARDSGAIEIELTLCATMMRALPPSLIDERIALARACRDRLAAAGDCAPRALLARCWLEASCALGNGHRDDSCRCAATAASLLAPDPGEHVDPFLRYHAWCQLACASAMTGRLDEADDALGQALAMEDPRWPAERLIWGAEAAQFVCHARGQDAAALAQARRAVELDRRRGKDASIVLANLVYLELHAGNVEDAVRRGTELVASLQGTRHAFTLALARLNLLSALVTAGDAPRSRDVALELWPQMEFFDWGYYVLGYLARLATLEGRPRAAALLIGQSDRLTGERAQERPAPARLAAEAQARDAAQAALGEVEFEQLRAVGAGLPPAALRDTAFARHDA